MLFRSAFEEAIAGRAYASALQVGEQALELWDQVPDAAERAGRSRSQLISAVAEAAIDAGDRKRGLAWIADALAATELDDRLARVDLLRSRAGLLADEGLPGAEEALREALAELGDGDEAAWIKGFQFALAGPIYAGTNEIQRNVVAERVLGLPRR